MRVIDHQQGPARRAEAFHPARDAADRGQGAGGFLGWHTRRAKGREGGQVVVDIKATRQTGLDPRLAPGAQQAEAITEAPRLGLAADDLGPCLATGGIGHNGKIRGQAPAELSAMGIIYVHDGLS